MVSSHFKFLDKFACDTNFNDVEENFDAVGKKGSSMNYLELMLRNILDGVRLWRDVRVR